MTNKLIPREPVPERRNRANRAAAAVLAFACTCDVHSGVTVDGTISTATTIAGPSFQVNAAHGVQVGSNLFHSFGQFSIATGESATFNGPPGLANIVGRVTGGAPSSINGLIASTVAGANLYLVNPAGFLFGPNAALGLTGSFYASSANYLKFADGAVFHASNPAASTLTAAAPSAFGFLGSPGAIAVNGSRLTVPTGKGLGLVGGDVSVSDGAQAQTLRARGGRIDIVSVSGSGEAAIGAGGVVPASGVALGTVTLSGNPAAPTTNTTLETSELASSSGAGAISIRGGRIVLNGAKLRAKTVNGSSAGIGIFATGDVEIVGGEVVTVTTGAGNAGPISISGNNVYVSNGTLVDTSCDPGCTTGAGGALSVSAAGLLRITGSAAYGTPTGVVSNSFGGGPTGLVELGAPAVDLSGAVLVQSQALGTGNASGVRISGGSLSLGGGAQVSVDTTAAGAAGSLNVGLSGSLSISGQGVDPFSSQTVPSGLFANTSSTANGGSIAVNAGSVSVLSGGEISSSSRATATGSGGAIVINASGPVLVAGEDFSTGSPKSSAIVSNTFGSGHAGSIAITTPTLTIAGMGRIQAQTSGNSISGDIALNAGTLRLLDGGQVSVDARGLFSRGGTMRVKADTVTISGPDSGLFAKSYVEFSLGGNIEIAADWLAISNGGGVFAGALFRGAEGGTIRIQASRGVALGSGASITTQALGTSLAGDITVDAGARLELTDSTISTEALKSDGGNITIRARDLISLARSSITTAVGSGKGSGGNISIDPAFLVLNQSSIVANAFGGNGGNINIVAGSFFRSPDSVVSASSQLGVSGTIVISSPVVDLSGSLAALPVSYLNAAALAGNPCAARLAGRASSLVLAGRGGVPFSADGYLPMFALGDAAPAASLPASDGLRTRNDIPARRLALTGCTAG